MGVQERQCGLERQRRSEAVHGQEKEGSQKEVRRTFKMLREV